MIFSKSCFPLILILFLNLKKSCILYKSIHQISISGIIQFVWNYDRRKLWRLVLQKGFIQFSFPQLPFRLVSSNCTFCLSLACVFMKISVQSGRLQFLISSECVPISNPSKLHSNCRYETVLSIKVWVGLHEEWIFGLVPFLLLF